MKKYLMLLAFLLLFLPGSRAKAQCVSFGCMGPGYYFDAANYIYFMDYATTAEKAAFAIDNAFAALFSSINLIEQGNAMEANINSRRNALENYKSVKAYYTEGIPPFASRGPDGRPRSPKITWQDVESIGIE